MTKYRAQNLSLNLFYYFLFNDQVSNQAVEIILAASQLNCFSCWKYWL